MSPGGGARPCGGATRRPTRADSASQSFQRKSAKDAKEQKSLNAKAAKPQRKITASTPRPRRINSGSVVGRQAAALARTRTRRHRQEWQWITAVARNYRKRPNVPPLALSWRTLPFERFLRVLCGLRAPVVLPSSASPAALAFPPYRLPWRPCKKKPGASRAEACTPHCCYNFFSSSLSCLSLATAPRAAGRVTPLPDPHAPHFGGLARTGLTRPQIRH